MGGASSGRMQTPKKKRDHRQSKRFIQVRARLLFFGAQDCFSSRLGMPCALLGRAQRHTHQGHPITFGIICRASTNDTSAEDPWKTKGNYKIKEEHHNWHIFLFFAAFHLAHHDMRAPE